LKIVENWIASVTWVWTHVDPPIHL